jgi:hypothetical protein
MYLLLYLICYLFLFINSFISLPVYLFNDVLACLPFY